jgi:hypothetical protein
MPREAAAERLEQAAPGVGVEALVDAVALEAAAVKAAEKNSPYSPAAAVAVHWPFPANIR